jgi:hypothetical protein
MSDDEDIKGREVEVTFTWNLTVLPEQSPIEALQEYINSVGWAFDEPSSVKDSHTGEPVDPFKAQDGQGPVPSNWLVG